MFSTACQEESAHAPPRLTGLPAPRCGITVDAQCARHQRWGHLAHQRLERRRAGETGRPQVCLVRLNWRIYRARREPFEPTRKTLARSMGGGAPGHIALHKRLFIGRNRRIQAQMRRTPPRPRHSPPSPKAGGSTPTLATASRSSIRPAPSSRRPLQRDRSPMRVGGWPARRTPRAARHCS